MKRPISVFAGAGWLASLAAGDRQTGARGTIFRREFDAPAELERAVLHVTALGLYDCRLNGRAVGDIVLAPGWTDYGKRVYFQTYDVTNLLRPGANALGVMLGDGWYCGHAGWMERRQYGEKPCFLLRLVMQTKAGEISEVISDGSWSSSPGPVLENDLLMGETFDARLEPPGWTEPGFDDAAWQAAPVASDPGIAVEPSPGPPVRRHEILRPVTEPAPLPGGHGLLADFGQNISGRVRLSLRGQPGTVIILRHGEVLDNDGSLYTANLRAARATDTYIMRGGGPETWEPRFTFHGFRYAEISWPEAGEAPEILALECLALYSDMPVIGSFSCSDPLLNQLESNILWGQKGNFLDIPTDCPQRNERLGWTGDAQVFIRTAARHMDVRGFFRKWLRDMRDAQTPEGAIPSTIPFLDGGGSPDGGPAWGDAAFICPWTIYEEYGDTDILAAHYPCMKRYMDYLAAYKVKDGIREHPDIEGWHGYGDWLALDGSEGNEGATPKDLIGTAFYARDAEIMAAAAGVLGKKEEAAVWTQLRQEIITAFRGRYLNADGLPAAGTQTACVLALHFDLLPQELRPAVADELVRLIKENGDRLATGFVGTPYLLHVLEATGHLETAWKLLEQRAYPSWLFPVLNGATTIWERWDGWTPEKGFQDANMNSFNHYGYGCVGEWLFSSVAGLVPAAPGYAEILFKPRPGGSVTAASASLITPQGEAAIAWRQECGRLLLELTVPPGSTARLSPPEGWRAPQDDFGSGKHVIEAKKE